MDSGAANRLSIKDVAELAGVTPRAVRHYHAIGLLAEPPRNTSGYRRYGAAQVVALVRITRLRALGMPLPQIAERVSTTSTTDLPMSDALRALADEIDREIAQLTATRDRLRALTDSDGFTQPIEALTHTLQEQGLLGPAEQLRIGEELTASLLDALHPDGMPGVLTQAQELFADPATAAVVAPLRARLNRLGTSTTDAEIDALAIDVARLLPTGGDEPMIDVGVLDLLIGDRLNPGQRRFMVELRRRVGQPE